MDGGKMNSAAMVLQKHLAKQQQEQEQQARRDGAPDTAPQQGDPPREAGHRRKNTRELQVETTSRPGSMSSATSGEDVAQRPSGAKHARRTSTFSRAASAAHSAIASRVSLFRKAGRGLSPHSGSDTDSRRSARSISKDEGRPLPDSIPIRSLARTSTEGSEENDSEANRQRQKVSASTPPQPMAPAQGRARQDTAITNSHDENHDSSKGLDEDALDLAKARASAATALALDQKRRAEREKQGAEFRAAIMLDPLLTRAGDGKGGAGGDGRARPQSLASGLNRVLGNRSTRSIGASPDADVSSNGGSGASAKSLNELGDGIWLALKFLSSSDKDIRVHAGEAIAQLLKDCAHRDIHRASPVGSKQQATFSELTTDEMDALKVLATSRTPSLRRVAAGVLGEYASRSGFPRGKISLKPLLQHATELVESPECALQIFAVRIAIDFATKGTIWQKRLLEKHWFRLIVDVVNKTLRDATSTRRLLPHRTDSPAPGDGASTIGAEHVGPSLGGGSDAEDEIDGDASSSRNVDATEIVLNFSEEQRRLLKLAFEFIGTLDLDEAEKATKREERSDLLEEIREGRKDLINMLTEMCMGSSLQLHVSLLKLLFNAFGGLVRNLSKDHWQDGLEEQFIDRALGVILERAEEAAQQHQSLVSAILSQSMMQGDADDMIPDMYDEAYEDGGQHAFQGAEVTSAQAAPMTPTTPPVAPSRAPTDALAALTQLQLAQQQMYRQTTSLTSSTLSYMSLGGFRNGGGGGGGGGGGAGHGLAAGPAVISGTPRPSVLQAAELAANESKWAQSQRNAQQSNQLLVKKLQLVALTIGALEVVQQACASSRAIANATVELFEMRGVMRVLNMLYRSDVPGAKAQIAQFLCTLCENVSDRHKVQLCESGVIVRLLRLASPSSVYGKKSPGGLASSDEAAFVPSIRAITSLAKVDVIGARIVIAGGVGPLYSHANSTRDSRMAAKEALEVLGVGNVNDLVEVWTAHRRKGAFRELGDDEYVVEDKQVDDDGDEEDTHSIPLEDDAVVDPQPLNASSHRLATMMKKGSQVSRGHGAPRHGRRHLLLQHRSNSMNSTRSFYEPSQTQTPRVQRVVNLLTKWRRTDGSGLMVRLDSLRGDPAGVRPFNKDSVLGSGAFSTVYRAFMMRENMTMEDPEDTDSAGGNSSSNEDAEPRYIPVAVKRLTDAAFADNAFLDEIKIMSKLPAHRHICNLHAVAMAENTAYIISEMGGPHTLAHHLASARSENPDAVSPLCTNWVARLKVAIGISEALKALQSLNPIIVHLDLKSSNVLLTDLGGGRYVPKLCDFGLAIELKAGLEFLSPANHGTLQYMAPEVLRNEEVELSKGFDQGADTYSFAIVLWDMAHPGRVPWDELAVDTELDSIQDRIREMVLSQRRPTRFDTEKWPKGYERLMRSCWRHKPEDRPPFVRSFLTDPDSLSFAAVKTAGKDGDAALETIGTTLKRIMWDYKSARRVRGAASGRHGHVDTSNAALVASSRASRGSRGSIDQTAGRGADELRQGRRSTRLRRQSSVLTHRHLPLETALDYHDHDDESHEIRGGDMYPASPGLGAGDSLAGSSRGISSVSNSRSLADLGDVLGVAGNNHVVGGSARDLTLGGSQGGSGKALGLGRSALGLSSRTVGGEFASGRVTPPARRVFRRHVSNSVDEASLASNSSRRLNLA